MLRRSICILFEHDMFLNVVVLGYHYLGIESWRFILYFKANLIAGSYYRRRRWRSVERSIEAPWCGICDNV